MSKPKTSLLEPDIDNRLLDDRGPTGARLAKLNGQFVVSDTGLVNLRVTQSPIERAVARGTISEQHGRTAAEFYRHWSNSGYKEVPTNWKSEPSARGTPTNVPWSLAERAEYHRSKFRGALDIIHRDMDRCGMSHDAIKLLFSVVCDEKPFEISGKLVWPRMGDNAAGARAITYVRGALRVLTIEWGL